MTPEQFIRKWTSVQLSERSAAQQHFLDLCALLGEATPAEADPTGETFAFEKGGKTAIGRQGWADVWKKGAFAWEYKGPGKDLNAAYLQLKKYADMLENPPLLITSDTKRIEIHTNFTSTVKRTHVVELMDLADPEKRQLLRHAFTDPEKLRPGLTRQMVTKEAAEAFSELAHHLQAKGFEPQRVAHFLNRLIFCMFAEDVGLLPNQIFTKLVAASVAHPETFETNAKQLFGGMAKGGAVAFEVIDWFNGGLFEDDSTLPLDEAELKLVLRCAALDWSNIEPSIFGTLFERGLDPDKRSQQGAHYTDPETIMKIVGPVVLEPWQREWEAERSEIAKLVDKAKKTVSEAAKQRYFAFLERLVNFRVLDPACGSGNFLYLSLRCLKDFEKRVIHDAELLGLPLQFPRVGPEAVYGIEVNPYAAELARVTIWIGELQWMLENGFAASKNPILKPLDQIECRDAILNDDGTEPAWPRADVIVGNPPFLGNRKLKSGLGEQYSEALRARFAGRIARGADLCCYWFEKAREEIVSGRSRRAGLVGTAAIRAGKNREVIDRILLQGHIFDAWSDQDWVNDGADVRVSIVCFEKGGSPTSRLDGQLVSGIYANLTAEVPGSTVDITRRGKLRGNEGIAFQGVIMVGPFDVPGILAREWLLAPTNPNGRPNSDVLAPCVNSSDLMGRGDDDWAVDFPESMSEHEASFYERPFEHVLTHVKPVRTGARSGRAGGRWWIHHCTRPEFRARLEGHSRYVVTPRVAKHRIWVWLHHRVLPDTRLFAIAKSDDATFGILQSKVHEVWSLATCSWHGIGNDPTYNAADCFETFPFPDWMSPDINASRYEGDPRAQSIAVAAAELVKLRESWLNPPELVDRLPEVVPGYPDRVVPKSAAAERELKSRTLTALYNRNPPWLQKAHAELDKAVAAAYGWDWPMSDDEVLKRLFLLNQERAGGRMA